MLSCSPYGYAVSSAEAKIKQVRAAEQQTSFVLMLISTVALFTAFFVILSTLSMGMVERVGQLGTLRCLGTTRLQLASIVLAEAIPLGLAGLLLGVPVGLGLARLERLARSAYIGKFAISPIGIAVARGRAFTTLIGAITPMLQAMRAPPLAASRRRAVRPARSSTGSPPPSCGKHGRHPYAARVPPFARQMVRAAELVASLHRTDAGGAGRRHALRGATPS